MACRPDALRALVESDADEDEPVAHRGDDVVVGVPRGGDGTDDDDAAPPFEGVPTVGSDLAIPAAVVDLAQRGEHLGAGVVVHRQDRRDVLDDQQAAVADLAQQPAGGVWRASRLGVADSSAASLVIALVTTAPAPSSACTVSVLALPGPDMTSSQTGSLPSSSFSTAAAASTASRASVS